MIFFPNVDNIAKYFLFWMLTLHFLLLSLGSFKVTSAWTIGFASVSLLILQPAGAVLLFGGAKFWKRVKKQARTLDLLSVALSLLPEPTTDKRGIDIEKRGHVSFFHVCYIKSISTILRVYRHKEFWIGSEIN